MWLTHFWHSWSHFFIFAWDVTAGGILRTGVLICLVLIYMYYFNDIIIWIWGFICMILEPHLTPINSSLRQWRMQYIPRNIHTGFALLCFVVVIHWLIFPYPSGLLHWHCGNLTIAPVPTKQHWWIWINTSCEFIMNNCINTTKQSTTKPCAYFLGYTVYASVNWIIFGSGNVSSPIRSQIITWSNAGIF